MIQRYSFEMSSITNVKFQKLKSFSLIARLFLSDVADAFHKRCTTALYLKS